MVSDLIKIRDTDMSSWLSGSVKLTQSEFSRKLGVDIENDHRNRFFWEIQWLKKVVSTDEVLVWLGYKSHGYYNRKQKFLKLLNSNPDIQYSEIPDENHRQRTLLCLDKMDFEALVMQMRTDKAVEIRTLLSKTALIVTLFNDYERRVEMKAAETLRQEYSELSSSLKYLTELLTEVRNRADEQEQRAEVERAKSEQWRLRAEEREQRAEQREQRADEERAKAEEERAKAEEREQRAEEERAKAEEREKRAEEERAKAEERERKTEAERVKAEAERCLAQERSRQLSIQMQDNVECLRVIGRKVVPDTINPSKVHMLGLYRGPLANEWFLVRCQEAAWTSAHKREIGRSRVLVRLWFNVAHAIDVANSAKRRCRCLQFDARGTKIVVPPERADQFGEAWMIELLETIITEENAAHKLARKNERYLRGQ